ncbi:MAG: cytidylate kinase family protein [Firmicutes bacterium]|nr:cytidylate kinase family protein [Bacillota bacterium]
MHISITGNLGSGKTSITKILSERLGYEIYSTGKIQRKIAEDMGITTLELNRRMMSDPKLDFVIDDEVAKLSEARDHIIFDSRMAWHFAKNVFRVFISVDSYEAGRRVFLAERGSVECYSTPEEAAALLEERGRLERERFLEIYHVDYADPSNYDFVVDSTDLTPDEVAEKIIEAFSEKNKCE